MSEQTLMPDARIDANAIGPRTYEVTITQTVIAFADSADDAKRIAAAHLETGEK
jgi:hypothetical protein